MKTLSLLTTLLLTAPLMAAPPNVIILLSDDQGYGELSAHGNPVLKSPNLDRLHRESVRFRDFHVAPMCTPTRGQLMTGRDAFRNGAMNVSSGRTLLRREVQTMPEFFHRAGYRTGLFGKWHLGDCYPYRPEDRHFHEAIWFPSSHLGAVPDYWQNDYFNDHYFHNGIRKAFAGYTTDVFFTQAIDWMNRKVKDQKPFFCYLATATPHAPHYVPARYRDAVAKRFEQVRPKLPALSDAQAAQLVRYLAMIENFDENLGRLEAFLQESGQRDNTIFVFLTDNGSTFGPRYFNAGMRGGKTTLWEGGHRVPCFVRWPTGKLRPAGEVDGLTQVQDILPTLLDLCSIQANESSKFDGSSLADALRGTGQPPAERMLVINFSRMPGMKVTYTKENPSLPCREGAAVLWKRWRLLEDRELYNLEQDPLQEKNVLAENPDVVKTMRDHLNKWWDGVKPIALEVQPSIIGSEKQNPVTLTACEWLNVFIDQQAQVRRGERRNGYWEVEVERAGRYEFSANRFPAESKLGLNDSVPQVKVFDGTLAAGAAFDVKQVTFRIGDQTKTVTIEKNQPTAIATFDLPAGRTRLQTWLMDSTGKEIAGAYFVTATRK